jgi:hypothetical protein
MNSRQQNTLSTFQRIQAWLAEHPELTGVTAGASSTPALTGTPAGSTSPATPTTPAAPAVPANTASTITSIGEQSALLDAAVSEAETQFATENGLNRDITGLGSETKTLRTNLISNEMVHVATIARMAIPDVVRMTEAFRVPKVSRKTATLLASAESMANAGEQYKDKLVAGGLPADFPAQLRAAAAALKDAIETRGTSVANRVGASKQFHVALVNGRKAVDSLTVLIKRQLKGDTATIAEWMQLRRIPKVGVRVPAGTTVPVPVPVTVPAVPATVPATAPATTPVTAAAMAPEQQSKVA